MAGGGRAAAAGGTGGGHAPLTKHDAPGQPGRLCIALHGLGRAGRRMGQAARQEEAGWRGQACSSGAGCQAGQHVWWWAGQEAMDGADWHLGPQSNVYESPCSTHSPPARDLGCPGTCTKAQISWQHWQPQQLFPPLLNHRPAPLSAPVQPLGLLWAPAHDGHLPAGAWHAAGAGARGPAAAEQPPSSPCPAGHGSGCTVQRGGGRAQPRSCQPAPGQAPARRPRRRYQPLTRRPHPAPSCSCKWSSSARTRSWTRPTTSWRCCAMRRPASRRPTPS